MAAPEEALYDLLLFIGGLNHEPALEELVQNLELAPEEIHDRALELTFVDHIQMLIYEPEQLLPADLNRAEQKLPKYKKTLARAYEGLLERLGSTLGAAMLVERYKVRSEVYRKAEMQELAETALSKKRSDLEDVLACDLCAYLYDQGIFALYRARLDDLEPDILSSELSRFNLPLLIETKAYKKDMRRHIVEGVAQCVSYLSTVSATLTGGIYEAHYVIFRAGGPLYTLPRELTYGEFRVYPTMVDLASAGRGRHQAKSGVKPIKEQEILDKIEVSFDSATSAHD